MKTETPVLSVFFFVLILFIKRRPFAYKIIYLRLPPCTDHQSHSSKEKIMARKSKRPAQPVTLKGGRTGVVGKVLAMMPRKKKTGGCPCTHGSHPDGVCGAPAPGSQDGRCYRCRNGHIKTHHHNDAPVQHREQRVKRH